ncbi:MAG: energy transducer TonB [Halioglobus sp.]|jgi:periplasmic protein TonB
MYYLESDKGGHDRLRNAIVLALAVHAALLLGVSFDLANASRQGTQIEVTLATRPAAEQPDDASHIAQVNQAGSGIEADRERVTSRNSDLPASARSADAAPSQPLIPEEMRRQAVTTTAAARRALPAGEATPERPRSLVNGLNPQVDQLSRELASLEAELDEQTRTYANKPRVRRLTSVSAKQAVDAAYLQDWRRRVEAVGNTYYPEASIRYGLYGSLRLLVVIRKDGSLEDIRVLSSSGYAVLDEAAIKIVRMAAPFAPFPEELRATTDKLEIIRTWQFQENELSSG